MDTQTIYQRNLDALKCFKPHLLSAIEQTADSVMADIASNGEPDILLTLPDGKKIPYHAGKSQRSVAEDIIGRLSLKNPRIIIFLGMGPGLHIAKYAENPHPLNEATVIFEAKPSVFKCALKMTDLTGIIESPSTYICIGQNIDAAAKFLGNFFATNYHLQYANAIEYIPYPPAVELDIKYYEEIKRRLPQAIGHQFNRCSGDAFDSFIGVKNCMRNIKTLASMPSIYKARDAFKGKPGILIASGPSLNSAIPFLKNAGKNAVMAACPSALPLLMKEDIHPHVWMNIERAQEFGDYFASLQGKPDHIFVAPPVVDPKCLAFNGGMNSYILNQGSISKWLPLEGEPLNLGHSAAHSAFQLLSILGCDPIFMIGQDLCYSKNDSHAAGVWDLSRRMMMLIHDANKKILEIDGNDGTRVKTCVLWLTFLTTFVEEVLPNFKGRVYNVMPQKTGALIRGAQRLTPEDMMQLLSDSPAIDSLSLIKNALASPDRNKSSDILKEMKIRAAKCVKALEKLADDSLAFSMRAKDIQFDPAIVAKRWDYAEEKYKSFLNEVSRHFARYTDSTDYAGDRNDYENFFLPVTQGMRLRYKIEYFSSAADMAGDFKEISRKTELLFHMSKDEAYWARICIELLNDWNNSF